MKGTNLSEIKINPKDSNRKTEKQLIYISEIPKGSS